MSRPLSYTPPGLPDLRPGQARPGSVTRRHVFYVPGYDPEARSRYRLLFVRELTRYAKVFGQSKRVIGRAEMRTLATAPALPDAAEPTADREALVQDWQVAAHPETEGAETRYEVLLWDDIVGRDFARSKFASAALLLVGTAHAVAVGKLVTFYRLHWKYGNVILYPFVMLLLLAAAAALVAWGVQAALAGGVFGLTLPMPARIGAGLIAALAVVKAVEAGLNRIFFWQLLNDWVFNWQHGQGWRRDYERRLDAFADHVLARLHAMEQGQPDAPPPDEILIVGHSSGALTAVEIAARVIARNARIGLGPEGPNLGLVTLGSGLPLVALQPRARRLRAEIASLVTCRRIVWVDYGAPQDWMNFPGFNPIRELDLPLPPGAVVTNPTIRSARFRDIISPETYTRVRFRPFRMHFQFLMANDRPGDYDFFDMTLGPRRLLDRILDAQEAPGSAAPARAAQDA
ncbi:alpha/beta hydrolase [Methylobacterium sp. Leaf118]|uniref:alpha/beta hydrolase n=1 Tax=Methylobacterium sp. Leaf118 TaxID=2876562 RepID=UPI001E450E82|nr:alpha/beta hydrolase [Methylobacterium sp. Leaf118]